MIIERKIIEHKQVIQPKQVSTSLRHQQAPHLAELGAVPGAKGASRCRRTGGKDFCMHARM
eukprot:scaffold248148_cov22-Tisochrysis_lutea.AAC.1